MTQVLTFPQSEQENGSCTDLKEAQPPNSASMSEASTDDDDQIRRSDSSEGDSALFILSFLSIAKVPVSDSVTRLLQKVVRMLQVCKYADEDVRSVFAVAACHHQSFILSLEKQISLAERAFILVAQIYIAHCIVLDEYCCITNWHRYLFSTYCDLHALNCAVSRILKRMNWELAVEQSEIDSYIHALSRASR